MCDPSDKINRQFSLFAGFRKDSVSSMASSSEPMKRPPALAKLLELRQEIVEEDTHKYVQFLEEVEQAQASAFGAQHVAAVNLSSRLGSDSLGPPPDNSSLRTAFEFYAKLQSPNQQMATRNVTYELMCFANETLSFHELVVWMRDFKVVPTLLTRGELRFLWKTTS